VVPIYIQEKIHPQALIDALPRSTQPGGSQLNLFSDFNGLPEEFDQRVDFYRHEGKWSNRLILGDSLLVMTSLAEKEGLKGKVQTIYIVRVSGPFTVESLSPHRVLSTDEDLNSAATQQEAQREQDFAAMILDNLRKAGVQNTKKGERLKFNALNPYAGSWLNASGEYTEAGAKTKRVAVSIGPEQGTVGPYQVKEAAKEAVQGVGYDLLLVCGFAFDPHVSEEAKRYGNLTVLPTKMNPDLAMGEELLKKTGAGNLFMVFGEPDVEIRKQKDGNVVVEIM
jgi:hypothetical protein